ncbi:SDR family NAD(P)-dependent oxidoreductase [Saccharopolyspora sp. MS10]|uniref:SDR family NAD(P)-dependent oxidoreductase n=1 Tax=Saccharopolyspora sp. MS10 TaxID=3385973 RepID=UPI0039A236A2
MSRQILRLPVWRDEPVRPATAPGDARRLVVLCDAPEEAVAALRARIPGVSIARVESRDDRPAAAYEHAAIRLLGELQRLLADPGAASWVQVVCPSGTAPGYAGLLGALRTAELEDPALRGRLIEFDRVPGGERLAELLDAEFGGPDPHVRYTGGVRQVRDREPAARPDAAPLWRPGGVYLITGGAGGIGALLAADAARHAPDAHLVLCGRAAERDVPHGEYRQLDVTDRAAVAELVADVVRTRGRLDGVLHAAGITEDDYLVRTSFQSARRVLAPKVAGLAHLDLATRDLPLEFFLAFSSAAGSLGNAGQAGYAAANGFLDAHLAHRAELVAAGQRHGRSAAIGWPLWREGGMTADREAIPELTARFGHPLPTATALRALREALALGAPQLLVVDEEGDVETDRAEDLATRVLPALKELVAAELRLDAVRLDADAPLDSAGIDSLAVTRLNRRFATWFGALPKTLLYQHPTLRQLAAHLAERHPEGCRRWLGESPVAEPARTAPAAERSAAGGAAPRPGEPIAIIGLSGRYPDAPNPEAFWANLRAGRDSVREIPAERWSLEGFYEPDPQRAVEGGASYAKWGAFLDDFDRFDAAFFGIAPREAADIDPQERLFAESAWSVLEDAGYTRARLAERHGSRVGVFAGITKTGFDRTRARGSGAPRTSFGSLVNRVSYLLDLRGPSMPIDTMCSASLTAIHEACEHLRSGSCELAIAGGVNLYLHPSSYVELCRSRMLASGPECRSFGAGGDGFVPGEGVGAVLLKPLSRAEADGDPIRAVILGSAINHGGRTNGYTVPNPRAQAALIRESLARAGVSAADVGYVEAHGTGTRLGDPVEVDGLTEAFGGAGRCALGSAKSNIGHLEAAAGIAGLTKVVLQLEHGELAPTLHAERPNPEIDFAATPFALQTSAAPWERPAGDAPRIAGISSFGAGGANAHVVVAEHRPAPVAPSPSRPVPLPVSARTPEDLLARAAQLAGWLDRTGEADLPAAATTLQLGREEMDERVCFVASTPGEWREQLRGFLADPEGTGPWRRGRVRANRETLRSLAAKEETRALVARWITRGELDELGGFWAKGMPLYWSALHTGSEARVHLPGYPFAGRRFWNGPAETDGPAAEPTAPATPAADVERVLLDAVADALDMPAAEIERRRPFADYGLDSILGVNLVHALNTALGTELETTDLFDHGTVERLGAFLAESGATAPRTGSRDAAARTRPSTSDAVAVVGLAARYADAEDPAALWDHLLAGAELLEPVTRWPLDEEITCRTGSFLRGIDEFDPVFFGMSGVEAASADPQQRIFLEQCWNALEDGGYTGERLRDRRCGVYVGCYTGDYHDHLDERAPAQTLWGTMGSVVASRIAYQLDLTGPALTTDTSCSSSLVSLHLACQDLRSGAADLALAGGVFVQTTPRLYRAASRAGMLSPSGRCHAFDSRADGFAPGEGAGAVLLKRLADAERDGDHVYGIVRATGVNQDGTTNGLTAPSAASQERLLREVHEAGGVPPGGVQLVEAHGTGTQLGDPIEFRALRRAFDGAPAGGAVLGTIKGNLGHTQFAAGIAGVLKCLLALRHRRIPGSPGFREPNRAVALEGSPFRIEREARDWPTPGSGPRRAAVSSFGASGTNAHVVLEEHVADRPAEPVGPHPFLLSARTPAALREVVRRLLAHLDREPVLPAGAVAHSLAAGRAHFPHRLATVAADLPTLAARLRDWLAGSAPDPVLSGEAPAGARPANGSRGLGPDALALAYVRGEVDRFAEAFPPAARVQVPLPTYPFERQRYWIDRPATPVDAAAVRIPLSGEEFFLADHHVNGRAVLPGVVSLEAARRAAGSGPVRLRDVVWPAPFPVDERGAELTVRVEGETFRVLRDGSEVHAQGRFGAPGSPEPADLAALRARCAHHALTRRQCADALGAVGIQHGERLRAVEELFVGDGEVLARLVLPDGTGAEDFGLHPAMLDSAIQAVVGLHGDATGALAERGGAPALPFALDAIDVFTPTAERMWAHLRHTPGHEPAPGRETTKVDIDLYDEGGRLSASLRGYTSRRSGLPGSGEPAATLLAPVWDALPAEEHPRWPAPGARVAVLGGTEDERAELRRHHPGAVLLDTGAETSTEHLAGLLPADVEHVVWTAPATSSPEEAPLALFRLVKALLAGGADARELGLTVVTRRGRALPGDPSSDPAQAGVHGLVGTLAKEYPHWRCRSADVEDAVPWPALLELPADPRGETLAHRHGEWYRQRLLEVPEPGVAERPPGQDGVLVAIGGAGGIGAVWTEHVLREHGAQVVWIGRRPLDAEITVRQDRLAALGPRPDYVRADATDPAALARARDEIVRRHGPITGVLHSAIVLGDQTLARMDERRFRTTFATKADISAHLAEVFAGQPLRFAAFFSSMQSFFKAPGQANYAAGCTFGDAFAERLQERLGCPVKVMNWGYWAGVGIVTADGYRQRMARLGLGSIEPAEGMAAFDALLASPHRQLALLKATDARSLEGRYSEDALTQLPAATPSLVEELRAGRPDRRAEIERLRAGADGHAGSMHEPLVEITWALLRSLGLFADTRAATAAEWCAAAGIEQRYQRWMRHTLTVLTSSGHLRDHGEERFGAVDPRPVDLARAWSAWDREKDRWLAEDAKRAQAVLVDTTLRALPDVLTGRRPATDVMFPKTSLHLVEAVYQNNPVADYFNDVLADALVDYLRRRLERDPSARLRILEIGAGTGGTSAVVFRRLQPWAEHVETYRYTDISKAFLLHAEKAYGEIAPYLDARIFNAERPLAGQDTDPGQFDVVIATNVLHATRNIRRTLRNAKAAARPNALLLLNELSDNIVFSHLTFGLLDGWWLYDDPAPRIAGSPGLSPESWRRVLGEVGFRSAFVGAEGAEDLGQQVIIAESDGAVRQPRQVSAFRGALPATAGPAEPAAAEEEPAPADPAPVGRNAGDGQPVAAAARDYFRGLVADVLRLPASEIRADVSFDRYGIDSILVVQLTDAVRRVLDDVGSTLFFEVRTIDGLVEHFLRTRPDALAELVGSGAEAAPATVAPEPDPRRPAEPDPAVPRPAEEGPEEEGTAIAVVGMAGRYPGARDLDEFWANLLAGRDSITEVPAERWDHERYFDERRGVPGTTYTKWGGFLDGVDEFDPLFFGISPKAASTMDPQERLFLQTAHSALEDAGYTRDALRAAARAGLGADAGDVGVFVGAMYSEYQLHGAERTALGDPVVVPGSLASIANRVSHFFDASGPSVAVDTMCASALTAVHLAIAALERGECGAALAGGVNLSLHPSKYLMIGESQFAASDGRCRSFGEGGDGYVPGEGVGAVLLRPLADALADGDRVLGVIRGSAVNHGGRTHGFTVPNPNAQASVIRQAWRRSAADPRDIGFLEAHGTGTALGDPIEIAGLSAAFGEFTADRGFCAIGSAKSNIGHLESAAGIAGLSKLLLQLRHGTLVPSLHAERTNPDIDFERTPFVLQREAAPWPRRGRRPRLAGLSAFGAGGANAHLLVEEHLAPEPPVRPGGPVVAVLSAADEERLRESAGRLRDALSSGEWSDADLPDIAYTLQVGREAMRARFAVVVDELAALVDALDRCARGGTPEGGHVELGGGGAVRGFLADEDFQETAARWARRGKLAPLAEAWAGGMPVDWALLHAEGPRPRRVGLPGYPFARERYWFTDGLGEPPAVPARRERPDPAPPAASPASGDTTASDEVVAGAHEIPAGDLTLHPVWEPARLLRGRPFPAATARVLAVGLDAAELAALRAHHPEAVELGEEDADALASVGPLDHVVLRFRTRAGGTADERLAEQRRATRRLFRLLRELTRLGREEVALGLTLLTSDAFDPEGAGTADPAQAGLHGLFGGLAKEQPHWRLRAVDLAGDEPFVPAEVFALPADRRAHPFARRGGQYLRRQLLPVAPSPEPAEPALRRDGVYVLIGGAGDLGALLTEHLLRAHDARVVWVGRRAEDEAIRERARQVAAGGRAPEYLSADAADPAALAGMRDEVLRRHGRIDGVVHLAMVFSHTPLAEMTESELDATLGAKVDPCVHFADVFAGQRMDFLLLVSSLVSFIRNANQAHYSAACAFEDARAERLRAELGFPVKVVNWGYWGNVPDELLRDVTAMGLAPIDTATAMGAIDRLLAGPLHQIGFMRLGRPLPVEGVLTGEVLDPRPLVAAEPVAAAEVVLPRALAEHHAGPVPGEVDAALRRCLAAELRALGLDPADERGRERAGIDARFEGWLAAALRTLAEHGLIDAEGRWASGTGDAAGARADWLRAAPRWADLDPDLRAPLRLLERTLPALGEVLRGARTATDVLFPQGSFDLVSGVYRDNRVAEHFNAVLAEQVVAFLRGRRAADPAAPLRVLEIGAGTGGTTGPVLEALARGGIELAEYCFTDLSQAFLHTARDTFGPGRDFLSCRIFDAARPPHEQGLAPGGFDVVIAANVLHATDSIRPALRHAKALLRGGGLLALNEISGFYLVNHLTFGLLDGWWLHEDAELRAPGSPALPPESWQRVLRQEGFTGVEHPAADALGLGQQVVLARGDGLARAPRAVEVPSPEPAAREPEPVPAPVTGVRDVVLAALAEALRMPADRIGLEQAFADYGLDSIVGAAFVQRLNERLGLDLLTTVIFDFRSVEQLAGHIAEQHDPRLPAEPDPVAERPGARRPAERPAATEVVTTAPPARDGGRDEPIAVIGLSARFAGSPDADALWAHLAAGDDLVGPIERWDLSDVDELTCRSGSFLDGIDEFDANFFNLTGIEATCTDPQQRLLLEQAWTAVEHAGYASAELAGRRCGVYVGCTGGDYTAWFDGPPPAQAAWGNAPSVVPGRVAYHLDLRGPAIAVDTACSSSLVAVHLACQGLRAGETELALAGGVSVTTTPATHLAASRGGMLSPSGRCRTFDAGADGFVPGEGVGVVVLKRLSDALRDGDHVHAVIRGSAVNQDGATNGITAPSARSQERLIRQVHAEFGIDPAEIGVIEAHGTGTQLGDPLECQALSAAFAGTPGPIALGSIKTNLGHTTSAAGVAGLLKLVLSMRHGQIPASLHYRERNPAIRLDGGPLRVNTALRAWEPNSRGRRAAGLSGFGFSGTNGHLVVEDVPAPARGNTGGTHLFPLSGRRPAALRQRIADLAAHLRARPEAVLGDVSRTLALGRDHHEHRAAFIAADRESLLRQLDSRLADQDLGTAGDGEEPHERVRADYLAGAAVDFAPLFAGLDVRRTPLPTYPFQRKSYWVSAELPGGGSARPSAGTPAGPERPEGDGPGLRHRTEDVVLGELSRVLVMEPEEIDPQASFSDFGVDSILSVKLVQAVNGALGTDLPSTALFEHSSLERLVAHLVRRHEGALRAALPEPAAPLAVLPATGFDVASAAHRGRDGHGQGEPGTNGHELGTNGRGSGGSGTNGHGPGANGRGSGGSAPSGRATGDARPNGAPRDVPDGPAAPRSADEPIAVVGLAARFARTPDATALWRHLAAGDDLVGEVTRWDLSRELGPEGAHRHGSLLSDIDRFDAWFFRMSGKEAACTDPQQRIFLEECWHALEDAGQAGERLDGSGCGVYVGGSPSDYQQLLGEDAPPQALWGNISSVTASRISYFLDLRGPAISVDTACSSSLVAIHQACQDLRRGETSMALAGGVFVQSTPIFYRSALRADMLSARGRCHTFDSRADGFVPGEGAGVLVLKRLSDALRDGDQVRGVLRGSGMNQDGTTNGLTAPSAGSQERLLRRVHERAGIDPASVQLVEAHGTGTPLGDPIEFTALRAAFGDAPAGGTALGSIKTNVGHTQFAAGVAGVLKALLALEHEQLPPTPRFREPNPEIQLDGSPFRVSTELSPWPEPPGGGPRRAAVSSFGAAGTNVHAVLEQAPARTGGHPARSAWLVVLSGQGEDVRRDQVERLLAHAEQHPDLDLGDVSFTLATGRRHCPHRWAAVVADRAALLAALRGWLRGEDPEGVVTGTAAEGHRRQDPAEAARVEHLLGEGADPAALAELAGHFARGAEIRFAPLFAEAGFRITSLPPYPFAGERYWPASATAPERSPLAGRGPDHAVELTGREFFLDDHRVRSVPVLPGVAYLELACAAARDEGLEPTELRLRNVVWARPVEITGPVTASVALRERADGLGFEISTPAGIHGRGVVERGAAEPPARLDLDGLLARTGRRVAHEEVYAHFERMGIGYGPSFRAVRELHVGADLAVARLRLPEEGRDGGAWTLHPAVLDAAVQAALGLSLRGDGTEAATALPFAVEEVRIHGPSPEAGWAVVRPSAHDRGGEVLRADVELCDEDGAVRVRLLGFTTRPLPGGGDARSEEDVLLAPEWRSAAAVAVEEPPARHEVLLTGLDLDPAKLRDELGAPCAALPTAGAPAERFTAQVEAVLDRLRAAIRATRDGRVLVQVVVPARGAGRVSAALSGLLRTAHLEHPKLATQVVEVEPSVPAAALAALLRTEARSGDAEVRHDGARREVRRWKPVDDAPEVSPWRPGGSYLITGGGGGLGAVFAREIAARAPGARLVLAGRSAEGPSRLLDELAEAGARASYRRLDVTDRDAVERCVREVVAEHGALHGVLHLAGVLRDGYLARKEPGEVREVLAAKAAGFAHLDAATAELDLDCFLGFSSLSSLGNAGQGDYAAANAFLDAWAPHRAELVARGERRGRTLVIGWGLWSGGGMDVDAATAARMRERVGMVAMRPEHGAAALRRAWGSGAPHVLALRGHRARITGALLAEPAAPDRASARTAALDRLRAQAAEVLGVRAEELDPDVPLGDYGFDRVALTALAGAVEAERGIAVPPKTFVEHPTLGDVVDHLLDDRSGGSGAPAPPAADPPAAPPDASRREALLAELVERVAALLDVPAERITTTAELTRFGFDSLSLTGFAEELNAAHGLSLAPTLFFEHPTLGEVADHLLAEHGDAIAPARPEVPVARENPVPAAPPAGQPADEPIAVIGMSGRFPMAADIAEYWENLRAGRDCTSEVPADRWDWREHYGDPIKDPNSTDVIAGGFMDGVGDFDPFFFDISPKEAELMDPQQRLLMLHVWKAIEDAGYSAESVAGTDTALIAGTTSTGYSTVVTRYQPAIEGYDITGAAPSMGPNRMSYFLDLHGPSEPVDTACSSALVALHRAVQVLRGGASDLAIAGGVNTMVSVDGHISISKAGMLSPSGKCKTFGADADGYARGEGVGFLVLKRLSEAERDGDHVHGLIRATAENHGGRGNSLTAPNPKAQAALLREAYTRAGVDPRTVGYVEAHGTGTKLGDPVEINGLKAAFRELYADVGAEVTEAHCGVGSVKTNIGHLELAAGAAGVIKVLLQLRHRSLVPGVRCEEVNPYIDLAGSPFHLVRENQDWAAPRDEQGRELPRRAGVSSFGFGGVNTHVVLEEYVPRAAPAERSAPRAPLPVVLSATHPEVLRQLATDWLAALRGGTHTDADLTAIARTSQLGRTPMRERLAVSARTVRELCDGLEAWLRGERHPEVHAGRVARGTAPPELPAELAGPREFAGLSGPERSRLAQLWVRGAEVRWERFETGQPPRRLPLPTYPFRLRRYWVDTSRPAAGGPGSTGGPKHPLVHENTSDLTEHRYSSRFTGAEFFLEDHRVGAEVVSVVTDWRGAPAAGTGEPTARVLPAVAYLEMAREAAVRAAGGDARSWSFRLACWLNPLVVRETTEVHVALAPRDGGGLDYEVYTGDPGGERTALARGQLRRGDPAPAARLDLAALRAECDGPVLRADAVYERYTRFGMAYGPALRAVESLRTGSRQAVARLVLPAAARAEGLVLNPSVLDCALQATAGVFLDQDAAGAALPYALRELEVLRPTPETGWAVVRFAEDDHAGAVRRLDVDVCDDDGEICARLRGFSVRRVGGDGSPERPAEDEPGDAHLLDLIDAIGRRSLSADEFKRSLA